MSLSFFQVFKVFQVLWEPCLLIWPFTEILVAIKLQTSTNPCDTGTRCVRFLNTIIPITMTTKTAMQAMAMPRLDPLANDFPFIPFIGPILM